MSSSFVIVGEVKTYTPSDVQSSDPDDRVIGTAWPDGLNAQLSILNGLDGVVFVCPDPSDIASGLACPPGTTLITPPVRNGAALWLYSEGSGIGVAVTPLLIGSERR